MSTDTAAKPPDRGAPSSRLRSFLYWILLGTSLLFSVTAIQQYFSTRTQLEDERQNLVECRSIAEQLGTLATRPKLASIESSASDTGATRINAAIRDAGIASTSLRAVSPSPTIRLGATDYQQRETTIDFAKVTLMQIVLFEQSLDAGLGLTLSESTLSVPEDTSLGSTVEELWDARLTLTQIIYSPKSPK